MSCASALIMSGLRFLEFTQIYTRKDGTHIPGMDTPASPWTSSLSTSPWETSTGVLELTLISAPPGSLG